MTGYFIRRFLLIIPTFLGITLITFIILQMVPGGPLEMELMKLRGMNQQGGDVSTSSGNTGQTVTIPESALEEMKKFYGFDEPNYLVRYGKWLGNLAQPGLNNLIQAICRGTLPVK